MSSALTTTRTLDTFVQIALRAVATNSYMSIDDWNGALFNKVMEWIRDSESITRIQITSSSLRCLRIRTEEDIALLFETLGTLPNLKVLVLHDVVKSRSDMENFENYLRSIPSPLSSLYTVGTGEIPSSTFRALASVRTMRSLRVQCDRTIDGESMVRSLILNNSPLKTVKFSGKCGNPYEMYRALADLLPLNTTLETLHLPDCEEFIPQDPGPAIKALLDSLKSNSTLKSLEMEGRPPDTTLLCTILADVLAVNSTLQDLAMPHCDSLPTRPALQALVNTMRNSNHSLRNLTMNYPRYLEDRDYHELMWYVELNGRGGGRLKANSRAKCGPDLKLIFARGIRKYDLDWLYYVLRACPEICKSRDSCS